MVWVRISNDAAPMKDGAGHYLLFKWAKAVWVKVCGDVSTDLKSRRVAGTFRVELSPDLTQLRYVVDRIPDGAPRTHTVTYHSLEEHHDAREGDFCRKFGDGLLVIRRYYNSI